MKRILALCLLTSFALADANDQEERIQKIERQLNRTKPTGRTCNVSYGFAFTADFLYWRASNHGFIYAFHNKTNASTTGSLEGDWKRIGYEWSPGYRLGFDWATNHDNWDLYFTYTHFRNHSDAKTDADHNAFGKGLSSVQNLIGGAPFTTLGEMKAQWTLDYNVVDFECGYSFYLRKTFCVRPQIGLRGAWIDQDFHVKGEGALTTVAGGAFNFTTPIHFKGDNDFWGVGPRMGVRADWHFGPGFSFFGNFSGAYLYGRMHSVSTQKAVRVGSGLQVTEKSHDRFTDLFPTIHYCTGIAWGTCFNANRTYFGLNLAWESNYWWDQMDINNTHDLFQNMPLTLAGLTLRAKLAF